MLILRGRRSTLDAWCGVFFANHNARAASSGDNAQITWQAWDILRVPFSWQGQYLVQMHCEMLFCLAAAVWGTCTLRFTFATLHFTLYTSHFTLATPRSTLYSLHSTLFTLYFTLYSFSCGHYTLHFIPPCTDYTMHLHTLHFHFALYTWHYTLHTLHLKLYTLNFTLHTLHFTLHVLHLTLRTIHFTLHSPHFYKLHFTLCTRHILPFALLHFTF